MPVCTHQKKKKTDKHNESDYTNDITEFASEHIQAVVHCKLSVVFCFHIIVAIVPLRGAI